MTDPGDVSGRTRLPSHPPPPPVAPLPFCSAPVPARAVICPACGVILAVEATDARIRPNTRAGCTSVCREAVMRFLRQRYAVLWLMALAALADPRPPIAALVYCSWRVLRPGSYDPPRALAHYVADFGRRGAGQFCCSPTISDRELS